MSGGYGAGGGTALKSAQKTHAPLATPFTAVTPSAVANTYGSYAQIVASTATDLELVAVVIAPTLTNQANQWLVQIATGSAGNEVDIIGVPFSTVATNGGQSVCFPLPQAWGTLNAGTRVATRAQQADASADILRVSVWGRTV